MKLLEVSNILRNDSYTYVSNYQPIINYIGKQKIIDSIFNCNELKELKNLYKRDKYLNGSRKFNLYYWDFKGLCIVRLFNSLSNTLKITCYSLSQLTCLAKDTIRLYFNGGIN